MLRDYENQMKSGSIDSLLVLSSLKPQISLSSQLLIAPSNNRIGYDEAITNGGNYAAVVALKKTLFAEKMKLAQMQGIQLSKESLSFNRSLTQIDLRKGITFQYITAFADYKLLKSLRNIIALLSEQERAMRLMVDAGLYQQIDLMNLSLNIKSQQIAYRQSFIQYKNELANLNLLAGVVDTATVELSVPVIELKEQINLQQSPIWLQARLDSLKNDNSKSLLNLNYKPKLEAFADAGFMTVTPIDIPHRLGGSIGLNLSLPIYDGNQRKLGYQKIELSEKSRILNRDYFVVQFNQQYKQLTEQLRLNDSLIKDINTQIAQQHELIFLYKEELEKGLVRFTDYLSIINNYVASQNSLIQVETNRMQLINQLNNLR